LFYTVVPVVTLQFVFLAYLLNFMNNQGQGIVPR